MPVLVALCVLLEGMFFMTITKPGHVPDIWTHVYRIDSILNGDVIARPVTSRSMLHNTETGGGRWCGRSQLDAVFLGSI